MWKSSVQFIRWPAGQAEHKLVTVAVGHSPAGGAMVMLLLISLAATVWSGLTVYTYDRGAGPLAPFLAGAATASERPEPIASGVGGRSISEERDDELWEEVHEFFANFTLALVVVHVAGVLITSYVHRENLARAMVTGYKRRSE